ncbi:L-fucose operon activator [Citrobacter rodentium]|jgi:Transcriptional regulators of sugar metabolism|uniref:L-fucose operon activator n=2 Tax=Citrobacter rodentium TaxID=67825 RepID=D2TIM8_CITRI|nr:L-fucose operon activator [Citrobacter rodentium]KIQ50340.1 transcriptional regulator [Citrobacter rodentium]QBY29308.1 L-fucose operon activator [Citrobacter rodentium]UHO33288.1 L-fucose operon activator [Citrobacter rodentium NBRC 105723 = DSM 16636]CBG89590.1 L-fucose operon activator [Citrobacter rodentium ICC168]HAT8013773.1 transcriptional regulator [Citrobacter rodentium NBRC 105723 = DSM 16636]
MKALRQQAIVDLLGRHQSLTTDALSVQLNVSKETIRRDLSELQAQGKVLRSHGRAKSLRRESADSGDPFSIRLKSHYAHKADIARKALGWIDNGMVIALDASSTCWYLARQLPDINIQVFTNSQPVCQELSKRERIQLICSGGRLERKHGCYVNPSLLSQLKALEIDLFIFSCEGIDRHGALWDSSAFNAEFKTVLLNRAAQSLLLIDKSKFNRSGEARLGHLDEVTHIVTDASQL